MFTTETLLVTDAHKGKRKPHFLGMSLFNLVIHLPQQLIVLSQTILTRSINPAQKRPKSLVNDLY